jgi:phage replication-related protein YjqB (UPF0714/DUF867 family)
MEIAEGGSAIEMANCSMIRDFSAVFSVYFFELLRNTDSSFSLTAQFE